MKKPFIFLILAALLSSAAALAQSNVNVSILYGWNGTAYGGFV